MSISHLSKVYVYLLLKPSCQVMLLDLLVVWNCTHFLQHVDARRRSLQRPQRITHVLQLASCKSTLTLPVHMRANTCISSYHHIYIPISWANCFRWLEVSNLFSCLAIVPNLTGCAMEGGRRRSVLQQKTSYIPELYRIVRTTYNIYNRYDENPLRDTKAKPMELYSNNMQQCFQKPLNQDNDNRYNWSSWKGWIKVYTTYHHQSTITNYIKLPQSIIFWQLCQNRPLEAIVWANSRALLRDKG